jgi:hypothetical protein
MGFVLFFKLTQGSNPMNVELWKKIDSLIIQGKLNKAITDLESDLASCKSERFKSLIGSNFTNDPIEIAEKINEFISFCESKGKTVAGGKIKKSIPILATAH